MSDTGHIALEIDNQVANLIIDNEAKANVLNMSMLSELDQHLTRLERDSSIRLVFLTGSGDRFFSAGADIAEWGTLSPEEMGRLWIETGNRIFARIFRLDAIVVALLNGDAFGGGLELALAADICIAVDGIHLAFPETGIGAVPGWNGLPKLVARVGQGFARWMVLTGDKIPAQKALERGLIEKIWDANSMTAERTALSKTILARSAQANAITKHMLGNIETGGYEALNRLAASYAQTSPDRKEGVRAFLEKRKPSFSPNED